MSRTREQTAVTELTRDFSARQNRYILTVPELGVALDLDRIRRNRGELVGELAVRCSLPGARTINSDHAICVADFNVSNLRARQERAQLLAARSRAAGCDWFGLLEEFCARVLAAERTGDPPVHLRDLQPATADEELDVHGLRLTTRHPAILFGDGGAAKSYLALYAAGELARHHGLRVLFADWEFSGEEHRDRLQRLFGEDMPDLLYVRCDRPLVTEADRLRRIVQDEGVDFVIVDSVAFACDGPPEAAEVAAAYFRAVREIGVGSLHVAHVSKADGADQKPFGSAFWHNGARLTWFAQRTEESPDARQLIIGCFCRKSNVGPLRPAVGFELTFDTDRTLVRRVDLAAVQDLAPRLALSQRMAHLLQGGARTTAEIAAELGAKTDSVEKTAKRQSRLFVRVPGPDGVYRIGLTARREVA